MGRIGKLRSMRDSIDHPGGVHCGECRPATTANVDATILQLRDAFVLVGDDRMLEVIAECMNCGRWRRATSAEVALYECD